MPCYFIDLQNGDDFYKDDEGSELRDVQQARIQAAQVLSQIAEDELPEVENRQFVATVRDEEGAAVYRATLTTTGEWLTSFPEETATSTHLAPATL